MAFPHRRPVAQFFRSLRALRAFPPSLTLVRATLQRNSGERVAGRGVDQHPAKAVVHHLLRTDPHPLPQRHWADTLGGSGRLGTIHDSDEPARVRGQVRVPVLACGNGAFGHDLVEYRAAYVVHVLSSIMRLFENVNIWI